MTTDFPDWTGPMLVKELRQGLRTNLFVIAFLLLQAFMIFCLMISAAVQDSDVANGFFWFFVGLSLLAVQPLRGLGALSGEFRSKTMDLVQLTRLNAWRITLGKWTALNAQTLLLVSAIAPYLVMRHFLGGVNFLEDLLVLAFLGVGSALLSAVMIAISSFPSLILRIVIVVIGGLFGYSSLFPLLFFGVSGRGSILHPGGSSPAWAIILLIFAAMAYGTYFFLTFGASRIAPRSENLALRKRLSALLFALVMIVLHFTGIEGVPMILAFVALIIASIDALTEPVPLIPSVAAPFAKRLALRPFAWFFTPGWHTGLFFFLLICFIMLLAWALAVPDEMLKADPKEWTQYFAITGTISSPLILIHLFFPTRTSTTHHFGVYFFLQAALLILTILLFATSQADSRVEEFLCTWTPVPSFYLMVEMFDSIPESVQPMPLVITVATTLIPWTFALWKARPLNRELRDSLKRIGNTNNEQLPQTADLR